MGNFLKDEGPLERCRDVKNIPHLGSSRLNQESVKEARNNTNYLEKNRKGDFSPKLLENKANFKEKLTEL